MHIFQDGAQRLTLERKTLRTLYDDLVLSYIKKFIQMIIELVEAEKSWLSCFFLFNKVKFSYFQDGGQMVSFTAKDYKE